MLEILKKLSHVNYTHIAWIVIISLPVLLVYGAAFLVHPLGLHWGDADFFFAMAEASRKIILQYHQFPWWNPWIAGGIPLYADPQFGLISIQTITTLIFGTIIGWKMALIIYILIGFYGFRKLFLDVFKTPLITAILLAYTWSFSIMWAVRITGHFTFFLIAFLPWVLYLYWSRNSIRHSWIYFGLIIALCVNTAPHYGTIMLLIFLVLVILKEVVIGAILRNRTELISISSFILKSGLLILPLTIVRLFFVYKYTSSNASMRTTDPEETLGIKNIFEALFTNDLLNGALPSGWGKGESVAGLGIGLFVILMLILFFSRHTLWPIIKSHTCKKAIQAATSYAATLIFCGLIFLFLSLGDVSSWSPYSLLRLLPIFKDTRVAARWLLLVGTILLMLAALYKGTKRQRIIINLILAINIIPLILSNFRVVKNTYVLNGSSEVTNTNQSLPPTQLSYWNAPREQSLAQDDNLFVATKNNVDQIRTNLVPFFDTKFGASRRCDESLVIICSYVLTKNADILLWSPNIIKLKRTAIGPIELNTNPSRYWNVNGSNYPFLSPELSGPNARFIINDESEYITLKYSPPGSSIWIKSKL